MVSYGIQAVKQRADYLDSLRAGQGVVPIRRKA